jgi:hypothetical protein
VTGFQDIDWVFQEQLDRIFDTVIGFQVFRIRSTLLVIAVSDKAYWLTKGNLSFDIGYRILDFETS